MRKQIGRALLAGVMSVAAFGASACSGSNTVPGNVYQGQNAADTINRNLQEKQQLLQEMNMSQMEGTQWYAQPFATFVAGGILPPLSDGGSHPEAPVTAEAAITSLTRLLGIATTNDTPEVAMSKAAEAGLITGPVIADHNMTRVEVAQIIAQFRGIQPAQISPGEYPFADSAYLSPADMGIIKALHDAGIFKGYAEADGTTTFHPYSVMSRAEFALVVHRFAGVPE